MKYFVKYLPVKDKPVVGDIIQIYAHGVKHPKSGKYVGNGWSNLFIARSPKEGALWQLAPSEDVRKVELFLCSHDIRLGNTWYSDYFQNKYPKGELADTNTKVINANLSVGWGNNENFPYRVVGKVSPAAAWLNNEDELDASYLAIKGIEADNFHSLDLILSLDGVGNEPNTLYYVKDPISGNYH